MCRGQCGCGIREMTPTYTVPCTGRACIEKDEEGHVLATGGARRLDWHVLLPGQRGSEPECLLLLGGGAELQRVAVELELAGAVTTTPDDEAPANVVAMLDGATESLDRAARALAPGGYLYWEVDRRSVGRAALTPSRIRDRLRAVGLAPLALYWVGPDWSRPSRFLPIEPRGPMAWYLRTTDASWGLTSSWLRRILRLIVQSPRLTGLLVPRIAVIAASEPVSAHSLPAALAHAEIPASVRASGIPPVLVAGGEEAWGRITLLAFESGRSAPSIVVKVSRHAAFDEATRHEHEVLVDLRSRVDEATRLTLPEPIALLEVGRRPAVVQDGAPGSSALARINRARWRGNAAVRDLERTADWLISLHSQTMRSRVAPGSAGWGQHVEEPLARFVDAFGARDAVARLFQRVRDRTTALAAELPIVLRHMDLGPWNVLVEGDDIRVIDWEVARDGPALTDLVYASLHWSFTAHRQSTEHVRRQHLRWLFAGAGERDAGRSSIYAGFDRYGRAMDLDSRLVPAVVVLTMVDQALDRFDRLERIGTPDADPWTKNRYVGYVEVIAGFEDGWMTNPMPLGR